MDGFIRKKSYNVFVFVGRETYSGGIFVGFDLYSWDLIGNLSALDTANAENAVFHWKAQF